MRMFQKNTSKSNRDKVRSFSLLSNGQWLLIAIEPIVFNTN